MADKRTEALQYFQSQRERFLQDFHEFLRIASISTAPEHKKDIQQAAEWLVQRLLKIGMHKAEVMPTGLHPMVYAENLSAGKDAATLLIYGHYDVQPVDPLDLWETPPFEPTVRGENLYARGASDMKGQVMAALAAVECVFKDDAPFNVKFFIEGEEEIGSPSMDAFFKANKELLTADVVLNLDSGMIGPELPTISYALRGLAAFELRVSGPRRDLHSGVFGGAVHNPAQAICELLAGMHDQNGTITLPGFYDKVLPLTEDERQRLAAFPGGFYQSESGVPQMWGEAEYTVVERTGARPTLEVNGVHSGFGGQGTKTVIPSSAVAKITTRLVPDQDPDEVHEQLRAYLEKNAPPTIQWELDYLGQWAALHRRSGTAGAQGVHAGPRDGVGAGRRCICARAAASRWRRPCGRSWGWIRSCPASACLMIISMRPTRSSICQPGTEVSKR